MERCKPSVQDWFNAIEKGSLTQTQKIFKEIGDANITDSVVLNNVKHENVTPLIVSAHYGHKDIVRWFLNNTDVDVNTATNHGWRAIHFAAKRGHAATVDMLCNSGAVADATTLDNETPLSLALESNMRDTIRKLMNLTARLDIYSEGLVQHCYRGMLHPDAYTKTRSRTESPYNGNLNTSNHVSTVSNSREEISLFSTTNCQTMSRLQFQSTSYDLELARRKRELIRQLTPIYHTPQQNGDQFITLFQLAAKADLQIERRLSAVSQLIKLLPDACEKPTSTANKAALVGEPYLRLIEVCICESHCPLELAVEFSRLAVKMTVLGVGKHSDLNGSVPDDYLSNNSSAAATYLISYILRLLNKLILKGNPQYRWGILSHLCRIFSDLSTLLSKDQTSFSAVSWSDIVPSASNIVTTLVRLGEFFDQPVNVSRFAQLIGLIARCLIKFSSKCNADILSSRFSDLADILVGWAVDTSSLSKGINLQIIYDELHKGLSFWFVSSIDKSVSAQSLESFQVNENIRVMINNLLEDSENYLVNALIECQMFNQQHPDLQLAANNNKAHCDPNLHFLSVNLFLRILSSILKGVSARVKLFGHTNFNDILSPDNISQWIKRLLGIAMSANSCYQTLTASKQNISRRSVLPSFQVPYALIVTIESSIWQLLCTLIDFQCSGADLKAIDEHILSRLSDRNNFPLFSNSFSILLNLIQKILELKYSSTKFIPDADALMMYFGPYSYLHRYKSHTGSNLVASSPSSKIFKLLCSLKNIQNLYHPLFELAFSDLKLVFSPMTVGNASPCTPMISPEFECLALFNFALITSFINDVDAKVKIELQSRLGKLFESTCLAHWDSVPARLRISITLLIADVTFLNVLSLAPDVCLSNVMKQQPCHLECSAILGLVEVALTEEVVNPCDVPNLCLHLVEFARFVLVNRTSMCYQDNNAFTKCVNLLINHVFKNNICLSNQKLLSELLSLAKLASAYTCACVRNTGSDLLLLLESYSTQKLIFPTKSFYSEFSWFTTRRPDHSATSLLLPSTPNHKDSSTSGLAISVSAFPSLPAVAGVLGIVTRGSSYDVSNRFSRLKVLKHPDDWMRRLSCLITPLPSDYKCEFRILQCTSFVSSILWHAAWAMVDFKLKVAPWAHPLKTFLALEGSLRAFLQPCPSGEHLTNVSQFVPFRSASVEAQSRLTSTEQLHQVHLLFEFLGYIERIIFNAFNGFAVALPSPMLQVRNFFSANENTCTQWFGIIRAPMINLANDLPLIHNVNCIPSDEAPATSIYHSYCILRNAIHYRTQNDGESLQAYLRQYGGASNLLVYTSKALHRLGAWEELKALAEWTDRLFNSENPFTWIHGIASLVNNHWDKALSILTEYLDNHLLTNMTKLSRSKVDNYKDQPCLDSIGYVAGVLIQMHISEGNYIFGSKLRDRVAAFLRNFDSDSTNTQSDCLFSLNSSRLDSLNRLSGWSPNSTGKRIHESSNSCFYLPLRRQLDSFLEGAVNAFICPTETSNNTAMNNLSKLTSFIRKTASAAALSSSVNLTINVKRCFGLACEDKLPDWLLRGDMLLNQSLLLDHATTADPLEYSTWSHLIRPDDSLHIKNELVACQFACVNQNTNLGRRLIVRAAKCLSLLQSDSSAIQASYTDCFDKLCHIASSNKRPSSKLTSVQTLRLYDCLARILWHSDDKLLKEKDDCDGRLHAFLTLTNGLKMVLVDENQLDANEHATQCQLLTESALRLFDWLELSLSDRCKEIWAEKIYYGSKDQLCISIARNLDFFTRLADEPWVNGLPILTSHVLNPTGKPPITPYNTSPSLWTNRLLMMATHLSPTGSSAIAWLKMANWCYTRGLQEITEIQTIAHSYSSTPVHRLHDQAAVSVVLKLLRPNEYDFVISILRRCFHLRTDSTNQVSDDNLKEHVAEVICALLTFSSPTIPPPPDGVSKVADDLIPTKEKIHVTEHFSPLCCDDPIDDQIEQNLKSHLLKLLPQTKSDLDSDSVNSLHNLLVSLSERQYTLHASSAQAYATFLTIADQQFSSDAFNGKSFTKLDTTSATLKLLDLLGMPSRKLRKLISGFLDNASPILPESRTTFGTASNTEEGIINNNISKLDYLEKIKISPTLGGPTVWEACLSQLLVRLNAPDPTISNCLVVLLGRLIMRTNCQNDEQFKWSSFRLAARLIFPSVVAVSKVTDIRSNAVCQKNDCLDLSVCTATQTCSFAKIITTLEHAGFGSLVRKVETFTAELQRITLLWEELWHGSLTQHLDELNKKITLLESEIKRTLKVYPSNKQLSNNHKTNSSDNHNFIPDTVLTTDSNEILTSESQLAPTFLGINEQMDVSNEFVENIIMAKYISALQPTLDLFSQLSALTLDVKPETSHEEWFQRTFASTIHDIWESLLHPLDPKDFKQPILLIRQLIQHLQTVYQPNSSLSDLPIMAKVNAGLMDTKLHTGNTTFLSLYQLSPKLISMRFGYASKVSNSRQSCVHDIPLPGHFEIPASCLSNRIAILPTKTRPKRLLFRAKNGHSYYYLLKGLEDLRLDDRIMHLFQLTNLACAQLSTVTSDQIQARTYSVTPLGVRSGLLQMVQGALPLYSLYKHWQMRMLKANTDNSHITTNAIQRPVEIFHSRLKKLLATSGQQYQSHSRASWPLDILKGVFTSLESDTPPDLLSRELWASNTSCASWWQVSRTFAKSAGLMSCLGYLIGLGDRHLDNLLIDLSTGHVIHIDYNICFDKGRTLRVAERVPFRLTRILRHPLGPTAQDTLVKGTFRESAEKVLQLLRNISDPFLIHLKAFIIDPLVDWQQKKQFTLHQHTVIDFTHLSAFYGGGSTTSGQHQIASNLRRSRRVDSEIRLYTGLVTTRLLELSSSDCFNMVYSILDTVTTHLSVWANWTEAQTNSKLLNERYSTLSSISAADLAASEQRCFELEKSNDALERLQSELMQCVEKWSSELMSNLKTIEDSNVSSCLSTLIFTNQITNDALRIALTNYYNISRIYLNSLQFANLKCEVVNYMKQFFENLYSYLTVREADIDGFKNYLSNFAIPTLNQPVPELLTTLLSAIEESCTHLNRLHQNKSEDTTGLCTQSIIDDNLHEINNLKLFVNDQGVSGIKSYCWALLDDVLSIARDTYTLETDPKNWQSSNECESSKLNYLRQVHRNIENLFHLINILHHQPSGTYQFSAGYEADVCRELNFLNAVRDATMCITQLHSNLTRLLLPEAVEAVLSAAPSTIEKFSTFVVHHLTKSEAINLKQLVDEYLFMCFVNEQPGDSRLHQVLIATHLALTNATAQMEEIALRIRSCGITAPAWYYVDIVSLTTSVLLSRATNWQSGAASLWGWEVNTPFSNSGDSQLACSWADEIYTSGLAAFVSVLDDGMTHWSTIRQDSHNASVDLVLKPFSNAINCFIGRLTSRTALASLASLAASRLFCALIEDSGLSIRQLVMENEIAAKDTGVITPLDLTADKLLLSLDLHYVLAQPSVVRHLKTPAANLIQHFISRSAQISKYISETMEIEAAERHHKHLTYTLLVFNWIYLTYRSTPEMETQSCNTVTNYCPDVAVTLQAIKDAINDEDNNVKIQSEEKTNISLADFALSIWHFEKMRINGLHDFPGYAECLDLATKLKQAIVEKQIVSSKLTKLDTMLITIRNEYALNILRSDCASDVFSINTNILERLKSDTIIADNKLNALTNQLVSIRESLRQVVDEDGDNLQSNSKPIKRISRCSHVQKGGGIPSFNSNTSDSLHVDNNKPIILSSISSTVEKLQRECLSEVCHLVKMLTRYEALRYSLLHEDTHYNVNNALPNSLVWTKWLENHLKWTSFLHATLKRFSSFCDCLVHTFSEPVNKQANDEFAMALSLHKEFSQIKDDLKNTVTLPLLTAIHVSLGDDTHHTRVVNKLLGLLCSKFGVDTNLESSSKVAEIDDTDTVSDKSSKSRHTPNTYALSTWQRIYNRLHGFDPFLTSTDGSGATNNDLVPLSTAAQVDACIRQATDIDNLALMYEGWTAWV